MTDTQIPHPPHHPDPYQDVSVMRHLTKEFGPMTSTGGKIVRINGGDEIPQEAIERARHQVEMEKYQYFLKQECSRRILLVTKDMITQFNIMLALATEPNQPDLLVARQLVQWIGEMRNAARRMKGSIKKDFTADRYWPKPPAGMKELVEKF